MTGRALTGPRWSTAATICTRQAAYHALGHEAEPWPEHVERRFLRGTRIGRVMAEEVAATLARQGREVILEHEAPWPAGDPVGVGHADLYEPGHQVIEVVSSSDGSLPARKPLQAAGYAVHRGVDRAVVLVVNSTTNEERILPVNVEALRPEVERIERLMVRAVRDRVLPDRPRDLTPGGWPCMECPFRGPCNATYQAPPFARIPGADNDARRLLEIETEARRVRRLEKDLEQERAELRARLGARMEARTDYLVGGVRLRRTPVAGRRSLAFSELEAAGHQLPEHVAAFVSEGAAFDRWTVTEEALHVD